MNYEFNQSFLSRTLLTSVLVGFVATIVCLFFNIFYREATGYQPSDFINVSSLIFGVNLLFVVVGLVYFAFLRLFKRADLLFEILFALITVACIWMASGATIEHSKLLSSEFRTLLIVIVAILGIGAAFCVPFFYRHRKYIDNIV